MYDIITIVKYCKRRNFLRKYIFSRISRRVVDAQKYDVREKMDYYSANRINC